MSSRIGLSGLKIRDFSVWPLETFTMRCEKCYGQVGHVKRGDTLGKVLGLATVHKCRVDKGPAGE